MNVGDNMDFRKLSIDETFNNLNTSIKGLSNDEVLKRKKKYGLNTFKHKNIFFNLFIKQLFNPIILLLIIALILKIANKSYDSIIILIIIFINMLFNTILEYKYEYPINFNKLKFKKATVIRDGKKIKIKPKNITIGDILVIEKNNYIKADIKVAVGNDIEIESPLNNVYNESNILLAGDYVKCGSGMGIVFNIGKNTEIYKLSKKTSQKRKQSLPFKNKIKKLNIKISLFALINSLLLVLILYFKKVDYTILMNQWVNIIISSIPIFYIVILVLILYCYKRKYKDSINSLSLLGSIGEVNTIICNKDELFTLNEMSVKVVELMDGSIYNIEGIGYNDIGEVVPINPRAKYKDSLYNLSLLGKLVSLNNNATLKLEEDNWNYSGNPFDIALISLNQKINHFTFDDKIVYEINNDNYLITFYKEDNVTKYCIRGNVKDIIEFCSDETDIILEKYDKLKALGYKVMGVAYGSVKNKKKYSEKDIKNAYFLGLVGFINPLKENCYDIIKQAKNENIKVIINSCEDINTSEIFGKELNIISKRNEIACDEDIVHNFNLGERIFDDFTKDIKVFSNVSNENLLHVIDSYKRRKDVVAFISNDVYAIDVLKYSNISITNNNSIIKCSSDLVINNSLDKVINFIKDGKNIFNVIYNFISYIFLSKIMEVFIIFLFTIFNPKTIFPINLVIWLDISILILGLGIVLRVFDINSVNYTKIDISFKKDVFKWIITGILISSLVYIFKISNIHSILFLIIILYGTLLFIYKTTFSKYEFKSTIKLYLFIFLYIIIQALIFSIKLDIKTIVIIILICLLPLIIMELVKFIQKKSR